MKIITLSSWASRCFDIAPGSLVEMPDAVARVRIDAGLVREATDEEIATLELKPFPGVVPPEEVAVSAKPAERPVLRLPMKGKRR